jgi:hypothetical protein
MRSDNQATSRDRPPHVEVVRMVDNVVPRTVYAAAELGLADHLAGGPKSAAELAGPIGVHAPSLH